MSSPGVPICLLKNKALSSYYSLYVRFQPRDKFYGCVKRPWKQSKVMKNQNTFVKSKQLLQSLFVYEETKVMFLASVIQINTD